MPTYLFFHRNNNFYNGQPKLRSIECSFDRWADVRSKIEEILGISRLVNAQGKKTEPASLFGCVVGIQKMQEDWRVLLEKSKHLPPLENGSLLMNGDIIIIGIVRYRSVLYFQDLWHRYWLYSLMKKYYTTRGQQQEFESDIRRYDLRKLVCRVIALSEQKANPTINLKHKNQILKIVFEKSMQRYESEKKYAFLFEFGASFRPCFGESIHSKMCSELHNINIDFNRRTKLLTKLIRESGGDIEYGDSIAKRLGIVDVQLVQLVRDVLHNYEPQYTAKEKYEEICILGVVEEEEEAEEEEDEKEEMQNKKRKLSDDGLEGFIFDQEQLAKNATQQVSTEQVDVSKEENQQIDTGEENEKIQKVIDGANDVQQNQQPIYNMQVYCLCCDVPGHHTNVCPRFEFLENLRQTCHIAGPLPWNIFYAPENGICPIPRSTLSKFVSQHLPSRAGEINRKIHKQIIDDEFTLPILPYFANTRWLIDMQ